MRMPDGSSARLVAGDGVAVDHHPGQVEDAGRHVAGEGVPSGPTIELQSRLIRWVSVPPKGMRKPCASATPVKATQFLTMLFCSCLN